ncbi:MAG: molybdopterin synthase sulfur carrier subunit [Sphingomonadales bacterium]|nr:molybdopterin synthase sulfur carrier subunit [Sphingomonadales bacterium]PIX65224.1 MAG: molybdopterin synthase sulfur carrier subunit [Sphingomonadales bacterium CG_4_10_14_3_um_filter_58_15]NCO49188.1 molybdopterin synthase sulfur carrier subunit [Sphingomonadales bacterium]NCP00188.1 molybdopterin synthase sulfur carrier subunit [Sphingomonadales bacterium]NCP27958.1 molybdopterin synthase sulfur carrier subunit [Sphingomonadales bacterium]
MARSINIIYFAWVRERLGIDQEQVSLGDEIETIADVLNMLGEREAAYADIFADVEKLRFALDQDYGLSTSLIGSARELAIFPPVTGG